MRLFFALILSLMLLLPNHVSAAEMEIGMQSYFRVVWGLAVVVAVMLGIYYLVRKRFSLLHNTDKKNINILEIQPIMPKKSLCLIEVHGKKILLGVTPDAITTIADLTEKPETTTSFAEQLAESSTRVDTGRLSTP